MSDVKQVLRRRRAPPGHIANGEHRNITVRLDSSTYNRLVDLVAETGTSMNFIAECIMANRKVEVVPAAESTADRDARIEAVMRKFLADEGSA